MNNGWHGDGWDGGHWIFAIAMMILFWGVMAAIVITLIRPGRWSRDDHRASPPANSFTQEAERILHERFARGEIDADEYTRRHDLLKERSR